MSWLSMPVYGLAALVAVVCMASVVAQGDDVSKLAKESRFTFIGTVQKVKATTMDEVPASESTAIVRVNEVQVKPEALGDFLGQDITVVLLKPNSVKEGEQWVFYTKGGTVGNSLAVTELGHATVAQVKKAALADAGQVAEPLLRERLELADLVITGKVRKLGEPKKAQPTDKKPITEHDPLWQEVILDVETVEKVGATAGAKKAAAAKAVIVMVPTSRDVMWYKAPKPKQGEEGVWILRDREIAPGVRALTATHPLDFLQPLDEQKRARAILKPK